LLREAVFGSQKHKDYSSWVNELRCDFLPTEIMKFATINNILSRTYTDLNA